MESWNKINNRPVTLTVLCILSFLGSGLAFFTYSMVALSYEEFMTALKGTDFGFPQMELILEAERGFFISGMVVYGASLLGVLLMWRLRKAGFHFYAMAQVLVALHPYLFLNSGQFPVLSLIISGLFITLYAMHLKFMS